MKLYPNYIFFALFLCLPASASFAQAFDKAPSVSRKVKEITEWHRPNLSVKAKSVATSGYDKKGNLIYHYLEGEAKSQRNTYRYDAQNRLIEKKEYFEGIKHYTKISYNSKTKIAVYTFHDKTYRTCDYFKESKLVERKIFAKGGEMENHFLLLKRHQYFYTKRGQLKAEKIRAYGIVGTKKGKVVTEEKIKYYYHPKSHLKIHVEYFNLDKSLRKERFLTYNSMGLLLRIVDYFPLEGEIETTDYLYQKGVIWQKLIEKADQKSVLVYTGGRPIRLRSYLSGKLYKVVDYGYLYY